LQKRFLQKWFLQKRERDFVVAIFAKMRARGRQGSEETGHIDFFNVLRVSAAEKRVHRGV
jgi:hypothetical protein